MGTGGLLGALARMGRELSVGAQPAQPAHSAHSLGLHVCRAKRAGSALPAEWSQLWGSRQGVECREEPPRIIREGFPVEVACKLRPEGGAESWCVKVNGGGFERALSGRGPACAKAQR